MNERQINEKEAVEILKYWQEERRPVEVIARFGQGVTQSHAGRVTIEPEGQLVVADVIDKDHYFTTILDLFAFESIRVSEMENAVTFEEPFATPDTFRSVTVACRRE